jgi:hypothetical protein
VREVVREYHVESVRVKDSALLVIERETRPVTIPPETATLSLTPAQLVDLPPGAAYREQSGRASVTATKDEAGRIVIVSNCDSLQVMVTNLRTEVFRLRDERSALEERLEERVEVIVREPTGFQWFQLWGFRLAVAGGAIYLMLTKYISIINLFKKAITWLKGLF